MARTKFRKCLHFFGPSPDMCAKKSQLVSTLCLAPAKWNFVHLHWSDDPHQSQQKCSLKVTSNQLYLCCHPSYALPSWGGFTSLWSVGIILISHNSFQLCTVTHSDFFRPVFHLTNIFWDFQIDVWPPAKWNFVHLHLSYVPLRWHLISSICAATPAMLLLLVVDSQVSGQ
jgi:hypothetical protein